MIDIDIDFFLLTVQTPTKIGSAVWPKCHTGDLPPGAWGKWSLVEAKRSPGISNVTVGTPNVCPTKLAKAPPNECPVIHIVLPLYVL